MIASRFSLTSRRWGLLCALAAALVVTWLSLGHPTQAQGMPLVAAFQVNETPTPTATNNPLTMPKLRATITSTVTATNTAPPPTATNTAVPTCANLSLDPTVAWPSNGVEFKIHNMNVTNAYLTGATIKWIPPPVVPYGDLLLNQGQISGQAWLANQQLNNLNGVPLSSSSAGWLNGNAPDYPNRRIMANGITVIQLFFLNAATSSLNAFLTESDFDGTTFLIDLGAGITCPLVFNPPNATPRPTATNTQTVTPLVCPDPSKYSYEFVTFADLGVVKFAFTNADTNPVNITGFTLNWRSAYSGMNLVRAYGKGASLSLPYQLPALLMWQFIPGDASPPTDSTSGGWQRDITIPENTVSEAVWFDFEGTFENLGSLGVVPGDFNGSTLTLSNNCVVAIQSNATVTPTVTRTATNTPSRTSTPTRTRTPLPTITGGGVD